jgi:hypothetical protein
VAPKLCQQHGRPEGRRLVELHQPPLKEVDPKSWSKPWLGCLQLVVAAFVRGRALCSWSTSTDLLLRAGFGHSSSNGSAIGLLHIHGGGATSRPWMLLCSDICCYSSRDAIPPFKISSWAGRSAPISFATRLERTCLLSLSGSSSSRRFQYLSSTRNSSKRFCGSPPRSWPSCIRKPADGLGTSNSPAKWWCNHLVDRPHWWWWACSTNRWTTIVTPSSAYITAFKSY